MYLLWSQHEKLRGTFTLRNIVHGFAQCKGDTSTPRREPWRQKSGAGAAACPCSKQDLLLVVFGHG